MPLRGFRMPNVRTWFSNLRQILPALMVVTVLSLSAACSNPAQTGVDTRELPQTVDLHYSWVGKKPFARSDRFHMTRNPFNKVLDFEGERTEATSLDKVHPRGYVTQKRFTALMEAIDKASWQPSDKPQEAITRPDDYPNWRWVLTLKNGETLTLFSTSNAPGFSPWNLKRGDKLFVSKDKTLGRVSESLYQAMINSKP